MTDLVVLFIAGLISVWALLLWWKDTFLKSAVTTLWAFIFGAGFLETLIPARFALASIALIALASFLIKYRQTLESGTRMIGIAGPVLCILSFGIFQAVVSPDLLDPLFRYTVLFPVMLILGLITGRVDKDKIAARAFVYIAISMAILAIIERLSGSFFVAGSYVDADRLVRDGAIRSIVGAEHPLVLSVLLVTAIPLLQMTFSHRGWRLAMHGFLLAGIFATNSRGALAVAALWLVLSLALKTQLLQRAGSFALRTLAVAAAGTGIIWLVAGTGSESLSSTSAIDASAEYRSALYVFALRTLMEQPFGWGLGGLPEGVYVVASYFGRLDVAATVDSEIALAMFDFGWLGVLGIVGLGYFLLKSNRFQSPTGQSALLISASGFYLALHSWAGLGSAWFLLLGLCVSCVAPSAGEDQTLGTAGVLTSLAHRR